MSNETDSPVVEEAVTIETTVTPAPTEAELKAKAERERQLEQQQQIVNTLTKLKHMIQYIDSQLPNRQQRKQFWREFVKSERMRVDTIQRVLDLFKVETNDKAATNSESAGGVEGARTSGANQ